MMDSPHLQANVHTHWLKQWAACMIVFSLLLVTDYQEGVYRNLEHDVVFWSVITSSVIMVGLATAVFLKKKAAR